MEEVKVETKLKEIKRPLPLSFLAGCYLLIFLISLILIAIQLNSPYLIIKKDLLHLALGSLLLMPILFYCVWKPGKWNYRIITWFYVFNTLVSAAAEKVMGTLISLGILMYFLYSKKVKEWYFQYFQ